MTGSLLLAVAVLAPALGAARGRSLAAPAVAFGAALALFALVVIGGPVSAVVERGDGSALVGLHADVLTATLLLLVTGVSAVVHGFAGRYLHGDVRAPRFFVLASLLTAATAAMVTAATLVGLAVAWTLAGAALVSLLGMYRGFRGADAGVARTARAFALGDAALWGAVVIAVLTWGDLDLRTLDAAALAADGTALGAVAVLLVAAALARSAQLPLQGWLPATLAAPTPVSALLHAGVVNAGGVLLVRTSPIFGASSLAGHLAFAAGAATALYATTLMLTRPDVKGALAHSTMAQMGFMVMTCGLGAFAAAVFHLVAHGMYKATLFLGSGGAVHRHVRHRKAPPARALSPRDRAVALAAAVLLPAIALGAATVLLYADSGVAVLMIFAWATGAWLARGWLLRGPTPGRVAALAGASVVGAFGYVALLGAFAAGLEPALTGAGDAPASPWLLAPVLAAAALVALLRTPAAGQLHKSLYVAAHAAGRGAGRVAWRAGPRPAGRPVPLGGLVPRSQGSPS